MSRIADLVALNRELSEPVFTAMRLWSGIEPNKLRLPFVYLGNRALKTHEGIVILAERGLGLEAGMLLRSLIEIAINVKWIYEPELPISNRLDPSKVPSSTRAIVVSLTDAVNHPIERTKPSVGVVS